MSIMELSPYLKAIQDLAGTTPGEKYRTLCNIVHKILPSRNIKKALEDAVKSSELPEALKPLVQVEIARRLRQPEVILEALKSENTELFHCALKARWFFNGGNENITTVHFYQTQIFPFVSVQNRKKLIRVLSRNLTDEPQLADEFYELVTLMYGERSAVPLLKACSESFIESRTKYLLFSHNVAHFMYFKYPELFIKYMKLCKSDPENYNFSYYEKFIPRLLKTHPKVFEELFEVNENSPKLSMNHTAWFLEFCFDTFMENPQKFLPKLNIKIVRKLTEEQREKVFKKLVDSKEATFENAFTKPFEFLSDGNKLSILMAAYQEEHKVNFLDCHDKITPQILRILPKEERIKIAKARFEEDNFPGDKLNISYKKSWITYLDCSESLQFFKSEIEVVEESDRFEILKRMIYSCAVNNDSESLLDVLNFIRKKCAGVCHGCLVNVLRFMWRYAESMELTEEHWEIISEFLMKIIEYNKKYDDLCIEELMTKKALLDLTNSDQNISTLLKYMFRNYRSNLLELVPTFTKISLVKLIDGIPSIYDDVNDIDIDEVIDIVKAIADFNACNFKSKVSRKARISVKDFPWLAATVKKFLVDKHGLWKDVKRLTVTLRGTERRLYDAYVAERDRYVDFKANDALRTLKENPELVNRNWKSYWSACLKNNNRSSIKKFVRALRWYQDLPIKFAEKSLKNLPNQERGLIILGLLLEGPAFERLVASMDAKKLNCIPQAIKCVSPPVSLEFTLKLCEEEQFANMGDCLVHVGRRTSVAKVIPFAMTLMNQKLPIKKYAIKLYCLAFSFVCTK